MALQTLEAENEKALSILEAENAELREEKKANEIKIKQ